MPSVDLSGLTIHYEREGSGEPLLAVMGLGAQLTSWPPTLVDALVARGFEVIRHDNRDAGLSGEIDWQPPSPVKAFVKRLLRLPLDVAYTVDDMADDAAGLLDRLGVESAHVVGASMGGMIAQALAIRHPERVRSLTSIMSNPGDGTGGIGPRVALALARRGEPSRELAVDRSVDTFRLIAGPHFDEEAYREFAAAQVERSFRPTGLARQTAAIMASPNRVPGLRRLEVPTLVVHGMVDPLVRPSGGRSTAQAVPGSRLLEFPDMGHDLPEPRIEEIADAIATNAARATHRASDAESAA